MGIFNKTKKTDAVVAPTQEAVVEPVKKEAKAVKTPKAEISSEIKNSVYGVFVSPLVTEKSAKEEQYNKYSFSVEASTTKNEIKKAFLSRYGVSPVKVNVSNLEGKYKRFGRSWGKRKDTKKAVVTLPKGKSVNVYETVK